MLSVSFPPSLPFLVKCISQSVVVCCKPEELEDSFSERYDSFLQVLDVIAPPYTPEFVQLFLPLIENEDITGSLRINEEDDPISEFICKCLRVLSSHVNNHKVNMKLLKCDREPVILK